MSVKIILRCPVHGWSDAFNEQDIEHGPVFCGVEDCNQPILEDIIFNPDFPGNDLNPPDLEIVAQRTKGFPRWPKGTTPIQ